MTLRDFEFTDNNNFVVMEYYRLILNRTFWVLFTKEYLIGVQVNNVIATESSMDLFSGFTTNIVLSHNIVRGDLENPYSYLKARYIMEVASIDLMSDEFLKMNANFRINKEEIKTAYHKPQKKWGMGYYPHNGRVIIETQNGKKREFIILGNASGQQMTNKILAM